MIQAIKKEIPANEVSREELLQKDVYILFKENRKLKEEIEVLKMDNENLRVEARKYLTDLQKLTKPIGTEDEEETAGEIAYYIECQRLAMGLSFDKFGELFGLSGSTIKNYTIEKGSLRGARKLAQKIRNFRRKQKREKGMAPANKN